MCTGEAEGEKERKIKEKKSGGFQKEFLSGPRPGRPEPAVVWNMERRGPGGKTGHRQELSPVYKDNSKQEKS